MGRELAVVAAGNIATIYNIVDTGISSAISLAVSATKTFTLADSLGLSNGDNVRAYGPQPVYMAKGGNNTVGAIVVRPFVKPDLISSGDAQVKVK